MGTTRTAWHPPLVALLTERVPPGVQVRSEVVLTVEPQRADVLLLIKPPQGVVLEQACVLRGLWARLETDTLVEFKSLARPVRRGDLARLLGYGAQYHAAHAGRVTRAQLSLVLLVTHRTPTLLKELTRMQWTLCEEGGGYARIEGNVYPSWVVVIDEVAAAERDALLATFGRSKVMDPDSVWWWQAHLATPAEGTTMQTLEGYDEVVRKLLASLPGAMLAKVLGPEQLAALTPEQRLAGLTPEQRLAGLTPEQVAALREALGRPPTT